MSQLVFFFFLKTFLTSAFAVSRDAANSRVFVQSLHGQANSLFRVLVVYR